MSSTPFPWLDTMPLFDGIIQEGLGIVGALVGQTFSVYRNVGANGSVLSTTPIFTNFGANIRRYTTKVALENNTFDLETFVANCDRRQLQIGDVFKETGYGALPSNVYTLVQMRPMAETIWMRTESAAGLTRPMPTAGRASQLPTSGAVEVLGYGGYQVATEQILCLNNGLYQYLDPGLVSNDASVQCGLGQERRIADSKEPQVPTRPYRERFLGFIPPTPGEIMNEKDIIDAGNGDRYVVASIFQTDEAGMAGWFCICERKAV